MSRQNLSPNYQPLSYPIGLELVESGRCPAGAGNAIACWFCPFGHATECHYPYDCQTALCGHYIQAAVEEERLA